MVRMYVAQHFSMTPDQIRSMLAAVGAADLVTMHESGMVATYLPFLFDPDNGEHGSLLTHVARNNRQWSQPTTEESLVIVHGPDHYVSPEWLPSLAEHGQVVPTWNYLTVHAYGQLIPHDDAAWTEDLVSKLTARHESRYAVDQIPVEYLRRQLRAIVGIEIQLTRIESKAKMSQNKMPADVEGIIDGLQADPADTAGTATANWMAQHSLPAAKRRADLLRDISIRHATKSAE